MRQHLESKKVWSFYSKITNPERKVPRALKARGWGAAGVKSTSVGPGGSAHAMVNRKSAAET